MRAERAFLSASIGVLLIALVGYAISATNHASRTSAYNRMLAAAQSGNPAEVITAARDFNSVQLFVDDDSRESQVRVLVAAAEDLNGPRVARDEAVQTLETSLQEGDVDAVIAAAESFFSNQSPNVDDPRSASVMEIYVRAFNNWFASVADPAEADTNARTTRFQEIISRATTE